MLDPEIEKIIVKIAKEYNISATMLKKLWMYQFKVIKKAMNDYDTREFVFRGFGHFKMKKKFSKHFEDPKQRAQFIYDQQRIRYLTLKKRQREKYGKKEEPNDTI